MNALSPRIANRRLMQSTCLLGMLSLAGCATVSLGQGGALISGHSPADAGMAANSEPQPINSLPPGAEGIGSGPNARAPDDLSFRISE